MASSVWKGYLSFGLVSFPVHLATAARPQAIHFHMLHQKDLSRIKEVWYCAEEDKPVERDQIVKGFEYEKGEYVVVEDEELKKMAPPTAKVMEILQFVRSAEVDPIFLEKSYYLAPEEAASKPYALLLTAMAETKYVAVAKVAMHGREHIVIIRPAGKTMVLHTMYFVDELHAANRPAVDKGSYSDKEMSLAKKLIDTLASPFRPQQYEDEYRKNVERLIEDKRKGHKVTPIKQPKVGQVVDIFDALKKSLQQTAKARPAASASKTRARGSKTARKKSAA